MEMSIKREVETAATSAYIDSEIDPNQLKQEPLSVQSVKSEAALLVKDEILEEGSHDGNDQRCVQGVPTLASTDSGSGACTMRLGDLLNIKQEPSDMYIGPTVFQHMDIHYTFNKKLSAVTEETFAAACNKAMPCNEVQEERAVDKLRDNKTISCKYWNQTKSENDYDEEHLKSCLGQQKDIQHQAMSLKGCKCDACKRTSRKLHLLNVPKNLHKRNKNKTSVTTSNPIAGPSAQSRNDNMKQKSIVCDICEMEYTSMMNLNAHNHLHSGVGLSVCHVCDAQFSGNSNLSRHLHMHTSKKPYQCKEHYPKFAESKFDLSVHMAEKPFQCNKCNARFANSSHLIKHIRVHKGAKPYQCEMCEARFARSIHLTGHMRVHTGEKPYKCDTCNARFAHPGALKVHMRVHTGEKPYQCDTCNARFAHRGSFTMHMSVHTGEKPYQCDTCNARFARRCGLTMHMRVHTGDKPYQCDRCDIRFARSSDLTLHLRVHTGEKPFVCGECGTKFARTDTLTKHMRRRHTT